MSKVRDSRKFSVAPLISAIAIGFANDARARALRKVCAPQNRLPGNKMSSLRSCHLRAVRTAINPNKMFVFVTPDAFARPPFVLSFPPFLSLYLFLLRHGGCDRVLFEDKYLKIVRQIERVFAERKRAVKLGTKRFVSVHESPILIGCRRRCVVVVIVDAAEYETARAPHSLTLLSPN